MTYKQMSRVAAAAALLLTAALGVNSQAGEQPQARPAQTGGNDAAQIARGRYIALIGGCNDCHTAGFAPNGGNVPDSAWLEGDTLGYRGPWGTTYPTNLRRYVAGMTENQFVATMNNLQTRPPMPFWAMRAMSDADKRALYQFIKSLGPSDKQVPNALPPGTAPKGPVITWPGT